MREHPALEDTNHRSDSMPKPILHVLDRLIKHVDIPEHPDSCWLWTGYLNHNGYAHLGNGRGYSALAHRASYQFFRGPIPADKYIDHLCRVRHCINPWHLELVTPSENVQRGLLVALK